MKIQQFTAYITSKLHYTCVPLIIKKYFTPTRKIEHIVLDLQYSQNDRNDIKVIIYDFYDNLIW